MQITPRSENAICSKCPFLAQIRQFFPDQAPICEAGRIQIKVADHNRSSFDPGKDREKQAKNNDLVIYLALGSYIWTIEFDYSIQFLRSEIRWPDHKLLSDLKVLEIEPKMQVFLDRKLFEKYDLKDREKHNDESSRS